MSDEKDLYIGEREVWGGSQPFALSRDSIRQHVYVVGKTGTGKSTLLQSLLAQDIEAGRGVGLIDPHGDLSEELLDLIPPRRIRDVVYFNAADNSFPVGLNLLRLARRGQEHLVASGLVSAFKNVWAESWGPRLEYVLYCSIAALTYAENATILGIQRMLIEEPYRRWVVGQVRDPMVRSFWESEFASYDARLLAEIIAPLQNKVGQLVMSPLVRNIVGQVAGRLDVRFVMDEQRILIANLAKGALGEDKSSLLGSMLVTALQMAAMSRSGSRQSERTPFSLYVDEFQNFATESFTSVLSEARKYGLSVVLAHQHTGQLRETIRNAVFGNVGTMLAFRVSEGDARMLDREFGGEGTAGLFTDLPNHTMRVRTLTAGEPQEPFTVRTQPYMGPVHDRSSAIIDRSRRSFGTPKRKVEEKIERWTAAKHRSRTNERRRRRR